MVYSNTKVYVEKYAKKMVSSFSLKYTTRLF